MCQIIAVSGPIAVGKSTLIDELVKLVGASRISTRHLIQSLRPGVPNERGPLQVAGDELDRMTDGKWVAQALLDHTRDSNEGAIVIVDSVRTLEQVSHLRKKFSIVHHVHLTASDDVLRKRFNHRKQQNDPGVREFATYEEAKANATEAGIAGLGGNADLCIDMGERSPAEAASCVIESRRLGQ